MPKIWTKESLEFNWTECKNHKSLIVKYLSIYITNSDMNWRTQETHVLPWFTDLHELFYRALFACVTQL